MSDHTYDPFGTRYEVEQYRPPLGGFDPVAAWGPRGAAAMLASHAFARGAGRLGGLDLLSRAAGYPENAPSTRWSDISATLARLRQFDWGHAWNMSDDRDRARRRLGISEQTPVGARLLLGGGADFPIIEGPRGEQYRDGGSTPLAALDSLLYRAPYDDGGAVGKTGTQVDDGTAMASPGLAALDDIIYAPPQIPEPASAPHPTVFGRFGQWLGNLSPSAIATEMGRRIMASPEPEPDTLGPARAPLPNVIPHELRGEQIGQHNLIHHALASFGQPTVDALQQARRGEIAPDEVAMRFLESGISGPFGTVRIPNPIRAYHGSPHQFAPEPGFPLGRFRDDRIGTGEGVQGFGRGHYISGHEMDARTYRQPNNSFTGPGHAYEVNIHARPEQFFDWNAPQHLHLWERARTREGVQSILDEGRYVGATHTSGYDSVTPNYVVFNPDILEIVRRDGVTASSAPPRGEPPATKGGERAPPRTRPDGLPSELIYDPTLPPLAVLAERAAKKFGVSVDAAEFPVIAASRWGDQVYAERIHGHADSRAGPLGGERARGFLTNRGRFVTRQEANELVLAFDKDFQSPGYRPGTLGFDSNDLAHGVQERSAYYAASPPSAPPRRRAFGGAVPGNALASLDEMLYAVPTSTANSR